jgi:hypothetical protein
MLVREIIFPEAMPEENMIFAILTDEVKKKNHFVSNHVKLFFLIEITVK